MKRISDEHLAGLLQRLDYFLESDFDEDDFNGIYDALTELAAYRAAAPLEKVREWAKAFEEGRMVVMPCRVGDTVYWVGSACDYETCFEYSDYCHRGCEKPNIAKVCETVVRQFRLLDGKFSSMTNTTALASSVEKRFYFKDVGKTVFLTREEAQAALNQK